MARNEEMYEGLRDGSISLKVAKFSNKTLRQTKSQRGKMAKFENKHKSADVEDPRSAGHIEPRSEINDHRFQKASRADESGMPTRDRGARKSDFAKSRGSHFSEGSGGVVGSDTPTNRHINAYPRRIGETFPAGGKYVGGPQTAPMGAKTGNKRMKGRQPVKSGGPEGHNARSPRYYGGPNDRNREGSQ